jgi:hypothetical protein
LGLDGHSYHDFQCKEAPFYIDVNICPLYKKRSPELCIKMSNSDEIPVVKSNASVITICMPELDKLNTYSRS